MTPLEAALGELTNFSVFEGLSKSSISELCQGGQIVASSHRERLFHFGTEAHFFGIVLGGAYKLSKPSPHGEDVIVHFSTPGDVVAAFIMVKPQPLYPVSATAMGPSRFLKLPRENYIQLWKKNPDLIFRVQNLLSTRMNQMQDQKAMYRSPLAQKVASLLMELLEKHPSEDGLILPLPLTRKEIADSLGASPESVIRIMSEWSKQGVIKTNEQQIQVLKPEKIIAYIKET